MRFPEPVVADVILRWYEWLRGVGAHERGGWSTSLSAPDAEGPCSSRVGHPLQATGPRHAAELLCRSHRNTPRSPAISVPTLGRLDFVHYFEGGGDATLSRAFVAGSDVIGGFSRAAAEAIVAGSRAWPGDAGGATAVIESLHRGSQRRRLGRERVPVAPRCRIHPVVRRAVDTGGYRHRDDLACARTSGGTGAFGGRLCQLH